MALKNLEEAMVDRIQRAIAKELKRLRRQSRHHPGNGRATSRVLTQQADAMSTEAAIRDMQGGTV